MSSDPRQPFGDIHDAAWSSGAGSMIGLLKRIASLLAAGLAVADTTKVHIWDGTDELLISASGEALVRLNTSAITLPVSLATLPALVAGTANIGDVDVLTVPADPFGADADAASVSGSISAKLRSLATNLAAVISGSELQVDIVGALPAGTNNIGDVDILSIAAGDNNIGNVDIVTVPTDPFGANADAASVTGSISAKLRSLATNLAAVISGSELQVDVVGALPAGTNNIGDVDVLTVPTDPFGADADAASVTGSISAKLRSLATNLAAVISGSELQVDIVGSLPAGTAAIGKLAANSGVDIGDVDVTSIVLPRNLIGPGQPGTAVDSYTHAAFNLAAGANQVLVSSAANKQIWVYGIGFTVNVAGTVSFQDEDDVAITGIMQMGATGGMVVAPSGNFSMPIWKLGTDKDLEVDVVTSELDGWIDYAIISV